MKKKQICFVAVLLVALFVLAACDSNDTRFEGRWIVQVAIQQGQQGYVFERGGEGIWTRAIASGTGERPITWSTSGDRIEITFVGNSVPNIYYFEFLDNETVVIRDITWSEGTGLTLRRAE